MLSIMLFSVPKVEGKAINLVQVKKILLNVLKSSYKKGLKLIRLTFKIAQRYMWLCLLRLSILLESSLHLELHLSAEIIMVRPLY